MSFALVQANPFQVVELFPNPTAPDPIMWPDGAATHGVTPPFQHGPWVFAQAVYGPAKPNEFYSLQGVTPSFDGTIVTMTQTWVPIGLGTAQNVLTQRINLAAESARLQFITGGAGQSMIYNEKLIESRDLQTWLLANPGQTPPPSQYPLLFSTVGIEQKLDGSGVSTSIVDVMTIVLTMAAGWITAGAKIETARFSAIMSISGAQTVDQASAIYNSVTWPIPAPSGPINATTSAPV